MDLIQSILSHITKASSRVHCILYTYFILQDSFNIAVEKMYTRGTVHTKPEQCSGPFCFCLYFWILLGTFILELHSHCYFYTFYPQILKKKKKKWYYYWAIISFSKPALLSYSCSSLHHSKQGNLTHKWSVDMSTQRQVLFGLFD